MCSVAFCLFYIDYYEIPEAPENSSANNATAENASPIDFKTTTSSAASHTQTNPRPTPRPRTTPVTPSVSPAQPTVAARTTDEEAPKKQPSHTSG